MSPGISLSLHWWRGIGGDVEPDLFVWRFRMGFATASIDKVSLLESYRKLRTTIVQRVEADEAQRARPSRNGEGTT